MTISATPHDAAAAALVVVDNHAVYTRSSGDPFFLSSGWASPVFVDVKRLISLPAARNTLIEMALDRIDTAVGAKNFDFVAGCELAGVPFAAIMADRLQTPLVVVRKQGKGFGRLAQFEGMFEPGARALLVDDLSTDGINKSAFRAALENADAVVVATMVLLDYALFPSSSGLVSLLTLADVIAAAEARNQFDARTLSEVKAFLADAPRWSRRSGGIGVLAQPADRTRPG